MAQQSRQERGREQDGSQLQGNSPRPLPKLVRAGLEPRKTWARLLGIALGCGIALAAVFGHDIQAVLGWSYPATLMALASVFFFGFLLAVIGVTLGAVVLPAAIRRWRGVPYEAGIARAQRLTGVPGRRIQCGPITACFLGHSHLEATFAADFEAVRRRFKDWFQTAVQPRRPLTVLVFERIEWYDLHLNGHLPVAGVYWMGLDRQIMICEALCLQWLTEPRWIWRQLLVRYFFEQHKGFSPPSDLASVLAYAVLRDLDPCLSHRVHRRLQTMLRRSDPVGLIEAMKCTDRQLLAAMIDPRHESYLTVSRFLTACSSLADYLTQDAAGERAERFRNVLRQWQRKDSLEDRLPQLVANAATVEQDWRRWILEHPSEPSGRPAAPIERHFHAYVLPQMVDAGAPLEQRLALIRHLGASGYALGIDALVSLLEDRRAVPLHRDVVWALESISGHLYDSDAGAWRQWWFQHRQRLDSQPYAAPADDDGPIFLAQLADDDWPPVTAELSDLSAAQNEPPGVP